MVMWPLGGKLVELYFFALSCLTLKSMKTEILFSQNRWYHMFTRPEIYALMLLMVIFMIVNSCGPKDVDKIADAQTCLDHAAPSEVDDCLSKLDGLESAAAYGIRCAGAFVKEGFLDANTFIDSLTSLNANGVTANTFASAMSVITFNNSTDISVNNNAASEAFQYCYKSEGKAATFLASFGYFSTALALYGSLQGNPAIDYDNTDSSSAFASKILLIVVAAVTDTTDATPGKVNLETAIGSIVISTYQISCTGGKKIDTSTCDKFENAINVPSASSSPRVVGDRFLGRL